MKLEEIVRALPDTELLFWRDSYQKRLNADIQKVVLDEKSYYYVTLEKTLFHPKGGGQPSDRGLLIGSDFKLEVRKVMLASGVIVHWCKALEGKPVPGMIIGEIDWSLRHLLMRRHTAAHLFDHCLAKLTGEPVETMGSWLGEASFVDYKGKSPTQETLKRATDLENDMIRQGAVVSTGFLEHSQIEHGSSVANLARLPKVAKPRLVTISGCEPIPCGGTHIRNVTEIGQFDFLGYRGVQTGFRVFFDVL